MSIEYPTTSGQASVWFADQYLGDSSAYNVTLVFEIEGPLTAREFEEACTRLVDNTPTLGMRMGINTTGDVVQWHCPGPPWVDWIGQPDGPGDESVSAELHTEIGRPLESDGGKLARFVAGRVGAGKTIVAILVHHVLMDGVSKSLLANRFLDSLRGGLRPQSADRYHQLVARVIAEEERALRTDPDYWTTRLAKSLAGTHWPFPEWAPGDAGRRACGRHRGLVPENCVTWFHGLSRELRISPFLVVFGSLHRTLARLGLASSTICTAASVRPPDGSFDDIPGCFINQLPLVARHEPGESLADLLVRESPGWRTDLRNRHLSLMTIVNDAHDLLTENSIRLDRIFTSYLRLPGTRHWRFGPLAVSVDLFNTYHEAKTDLCVRFVPDEERRLWYDVEWSEQAPPGLGTDFNITLNSIFEREPA